MSKFIDEKLCLKIESKILNSSMPDFIVFLKKNIGQYFICCHISASYDFLSGVYIFNKEEIGVQINKYNINYEVQRGLEEGFVWDNSKILIYNKVS